MKNTPTLLLLLNLFFASHTIKGQSNPLNIAFSEIDSIEYSRFKNHYSNAILLDTTLKTRGGSSFELIIQNEPRSFSCLKDYSNCYYYKGFLPTIGYYVLTHCGSSVCETFLMHKTTGKRQTLLSPYDNECQTPLLSKNGNQMLVIVSDVFNKESTISMYKKEEHASDFNYEASKSLKTNRWNIHEAIWVNDSSIAFIAYDEYGGANGNELLNIKYMLGKIQQVTSSHKTQRQ